MSAEAPERKLTAKKDASSASSATVASAEVAEIVEAVEIPETVGDFDRLRQLVPSERQLKEGETLEDAFGPAAPRVQGIRLTRWQRFVEYMKSINPAAIEGPKLPLIVCSMAGFLAGFDVALVPLTLPEIQADFGISMASFAQIGAVAGTVALIVGIPLGYVVDRYSRARIFQTTSVIGVIGSLMQALAGSFGVMMGGRMVGVFGLLPETGATFPLLSDSYPSRVRARVFATYAFFSAGGGILAQPLAGFLIKNYGWRSALFGAVLIAGVTAILAMFLKEPVRGAMDRADLGIREDIAEMDEERPTMVEALKGAWGIKSLRLMSIAGFVFGFTSLTNFIAAAMEAGKFGLDPLQRSFIATMTSIVSLPLIALSGGVADKLLSRRPSMLVTAQAAVAFISAGCYFALAFVPNLPLYILFNTIPVLGLTLLSSASNIVRSLVVPSRYRGIGMQIGTPFTLIAIILGPILLGTVSGTGDAQKLWLIYAPMMAFTGILYLAAATSVGADIRSAIAAAAARLESEQSKRLRQNKILVCRDIDVAIEEVQILFRVDLDIREGEIVALVGTNGAGKSTLLRAIAGLQPANNGAIFYEGKDITYVSTHELAQRGLVYMPGGQGVFPQMTVKENLLSASWMTRKQGGSPDQEIERILEFFPRLRERLNVPAGTMSGGEQQMLALGQAFLMKPRLLMIDELSLGLAPAIVEQLLVAIREMAADGVTVMLVEQSLNVALTVADRAVFMEKGEIKFDGPTEELLARPDLVRSVFMGGAGSGRSVGVQRRTVEVSEGNERLLDTEGLSIAFGGLQVLNDVSLRVGAGEVVGIIGPNGAGKTTLFDVLSGYAAPDHGVVLLDDTDITALTPDARARLGLGRAFQNARLFPPLTVRENIAVAMEKRASRSPLLGALWAPSVTRAESKLYSRVDGYIELLGLGDYANKFVRELSTGTRRALEVACQMAAEPKILLLDEPSSGLAQAETEALGPALTRIVKETGCGMLVIEHDLPLIRGISDRLIAMELGTVVTTGTPDEVMNHEQVLASYLSASADVIERSGSRVGAVLSALANESSNTASARSASPSTTKK